MSSTTNRDMTLSSKKTKQKKHTKKHKNSPSHFQLILLEKACTVTSLVQAKMAFFFFFLLLFLHLGLPMNSSRKSHFLIRQVPMTFCIFSNGISMSIVILTPNCRFGLKDIFRIQIQSNLLHKNVPICYSLQTH